MPFDHGGMGPGGMGPWVLCQDILCDMWTCYLCYIVKSGFNFS